MAQPVFYQTLNMLGVDPTLYYTNLATAGGSVTPEYPAPPYIAGTRAFGSDGSEFIFVQASTSISLTDFIVINAAQAVAPYQANSITTTNAQGSLCVEIASTGLVLKQSVSFIPAQAFFWACVKGQFLPATTSGNQTFATGAGGSALYTTATAGQMTTTAATTAASFAGFNVIISTTVSIAASIVPPAGVLTTTGFTQGPVVGLNKPRSFTVVSSTAGSNIAIFW